MKPNNCHCLLCIHFGWDCLFLKTKKNTARKRKSYNIHFTVAGSGERGFVSRSRKKLVTDPGMQSVLNKALVQWSNDKLLFQVWILIRWKGMQKRRVMEALNAEDVLFHSPGQLDQDPKPGWRCKKKGVDGETRMIKLKPFLPDQWLQKSEVGKKKAAFQVGIVSWADVAVQSLMVFGVGLLAVSLGAMAQQCKCSCQVRTHQKSRGTDPA